MIRWEHNVDAYTIKHVLREFDLEAYKTSPAGQFTTHLEQRAQDAGCKPENWTEFEFFVIREAAKELKRLACEQGETGARASERAAGETLNTDRVGRPLPTRAALHERGFARLP